MTNKRKDKLSKEDLNITEKMIETYKTFLFIIGALWKTFVAGIVLFLIASLGYGFRMGIENSMYSAEKSVAITLFIGLCLVIGIILEVFDYEEGD